MRDAVSALTRAAGNLFDPRIIAIVFLLVLSGLSFTHFCLARLGVWRGSPEKTGS